MTRPSPERLACQLVERRRELQLVFGESAYRDRMSLATQRVREAMAALKIDNPLQAALAYAKTLAARNPGEDVSTAQQFVLCAAADIAETSKQET